MDLTGCPQPGCTQPAEILDRTDLASTDGPVEHARVVCLTGHRFLLPTDLLVPDCPDESRTAVARPKPWRGRRD
jgi:hypothetical protein